MIVAQIIAAIVGVIVANYALYQALACGNYWPSVVLAAVLAVASFFGCLMSKRVYRKERKNYQDYYD